MEHEGQLAVQSIGGCGGHPLRKRRLEKCAGGVDDLRVVRPLEREEPSQLGAVGAQGGNFQQPMGQRAAIGGRPIGAERIGQVRLGARPLEKALLVQQLVTPRADGRVGDLCHRSRDGRAPGGEGSLDAPQKRAHLVGGEDLGRGKLGRAGGQFDLADDAKQAALLGLAGDAVDQASP